MPTLPDETYDRVSFKASHNSYEREEIPVADQLVWRAGQEHNCGCRGLELDLQQSRANWIWSVAHAGGYDGAADRQLGAYLHLLNDWSSHHRTHDPITVTLDLKDTHFNPSEFGDYLDDYIRRHLKPEYIFRPVDLMGQSDDLVAAATTSGWPKLADMKGKFVLCLSGNEEYKARYSAEPRTRLCFADVNKKATDKKRPSTRKGTRIFFNFNIPDGADWIDNLRWYREQPGLVTRGYVLNNAPSWNRALRAGINILATDKVQRYEWAKVGAGPFKTR